MLFIPSSSALARNWIEATKNVSIDKESIVKLNNPIRYTYDVMIHANSSEDYLILNYGIKCIEGKEYINSADVYSSKNGNFIKKYNGYNFNEDKDISKGISYTMYELLCLNKK